MAAKQMMDSAISPDSEETPIVETETAAVDTAPLDMIDVVGEPTDEELGGDPVAEGGGEDTDADVTSEVVEEDPDEIPTPEQREDGKWALGKYVADDLPGLVRQIEKGRRHAEKAIGKKTPDPDPNANPFAEIALEHDDLDFGDGEVYDEAELGGAFGAGIAQALMQQGLVPQPQAPADPQMAARQAVYVARQAIQNPQATGADMEMVLQALMTHAPFDAQARQEVLEAWGQFEPVKAAQTAAEITIAFADVERMHADQQRAAQMQAVQDQQQLAEQATQGERDAFTNAQIAWAERNQGWETNNDGMNEWFAAHPAALRKARGDSEAIYDVLTAAREYAQLKAQLGVGAGITTGSTEHGGTMTGIQAQNPAALSRAAAAEQRDSAGMEMGVTDDVQVQVLNAHNPSGIAEQSTEDLLGMQIAK